MPSSAQYVYEIPTVYERRQERFTTIRDIPLCVCGAPAQVAALSSPALKSELIDAAVRFFLTAIYLQPEFHRAVYNLGTAVYGYAQEALKLKLSRVHEPPPEVLQRCA